MKPSVDACFIGNDKAYLTKFNNVMCTYFLKILGHDKVQGIQIMGEAYGANFDPKNVDANGNDMRVPGGHAYPALIFWKQVVSNQNLTQTNVEVEQYIMGEGTAGVINRGHASHAATAKSLMGVQNALALVVGNAFKKQSVTTQPKTGRVIFNGVMLQSEIEHTNDFYGKALISSNALPYSKHHDLATDKPSDACTYGSLWFTKKKGEDVPKGESSVKLCFGAVPEDPFQKGNVVFADITGDVIDNMLPKTASSFRGLQNRVASSVRELAGRRIPAAHWDTWMDRMHVKYKIGMFLSKPEGHVPYMQAGRVARIITTFDSAKSLESYKQLIVDRIWNANVMTLDFIIQQMDIEIQAIQNTTDTWRSVPQLVSQVKCLAHGKKCFEEWKANKNTKLHFSSCATLNTLILTMTCTVPVRDEVYDVFEEEAKKPVDQPKATDPFVLEQQKNSTKSYFNYRSVFSK